MNKESSLVGRYRQLKKFSIYFKEVLTSRQKIGLGDFISYQRYLKVKTIQHLVHLSDPSNGYACQWVDGQSEYISKSNGTRACWTHVEHYRTLFR